VQGGEELGLTVANRRGRCGQVPEERWRVGAVTGGAGGRYKTGSEAGGRR
jgi:hypothetical protein